MGHGAHGVLLSSVQGLPGLFKQRATKKIRNWLRWERSRKLCSGGVEMVERVQRKSQRPRDAGRFTPGVWGEAGADKRRLLSLGVERPIPLPPATKGAVALWPWMVCVWEDSHQVVS